MKRDGRIEMNKMRGLAVLGGLIVLGLAGCGQSVPENVESSAIVISDKGQVTFYLVDSFDRDYYDLQELSDMAAEEVADFNASAQTEGYSAQVEQAQSLGEDRVKLTYQFSDWETYTFFNEDSLFYGTVSEADEKGLLKGVVLESVKDGSELSEEQVREKDSKMLIVTDVSADIYCPAKVTYVSKGTSLNEDGSVVSPGEEQTVYILLK
jgi:hypothetical protein